MTGVPPAPPSSVLAERDIPLSGAPAGAPLTCSWTPSNGEAVAHRDHRLRAGRLLGGRGHHPVEGGSSPRRGELHHRLRRHPTQRGAQARDEPPRDWGGARQARRRRAHHALHRRALRHGGHGGAQFHTLAAACALEPTARSAPTSPSTRWGRGMELTPFNQSSPQSLATRGHHRHWRRE